MATNLKFAFPDIPFNCQSITSSESYSSDFPLKNLVNGSRGKRAELATAFTGQHEIEFDLGSGVSQACDYLALLDANIFKKSGVTQLQLKGSSQSYRVPSSISGLVAWFDATKDVTYDTGTMRISQIGDQSGNSNNATQGTDANRPTLSTPSNGINGNRTAVFDGSNDSLATSFAPAISTGFTLFIVFRANSIHQGSLLSAYAAGANSRIQFYLDFSGDIVCRCFSSASNLIGRRTPASTYTTSSAILVTVTYDGTTSATGIKIYKNGVQVDNADASSGSYSVPSTGDVYTLGRFGNSTFALNGKIAEAIAYNNQVSAPNRQAVEAYLTSKWITTAPLTLDIENLEGFSGAKERDYIQTFPETSAYRYWVTQIESDEATTRPLSKLYFGKLFDMERDPQFSRLVTSERSDKQLYEKNKFSLEFEGVSTEKRQEFEEKMGKYTDSNDVLLYTNSYNAVMVGTSLMSCAIKDYSFESKGAKQNKLTASLEETY